MQRYKKTWWYACQSFIHLLLQIVWTFLVDFVHPDQLMSVTIITKIMLFCQALLPTLEWVDRISWNWSKWDTGWTNLADAPKTCEQWFLFLVWLRIWFKRMSRVRLQIYFIVLILCCIRVYCADIMLYKSLLCWYYAV